MPNVTRFIVDRSDANKATAFVLTIEPSPDPDPEPSAVHVLAGDFTDGEAALSVGHGAALGADFAAAAGGYVLAAPSGGEGTPYANGIWWLDPEAGPGPALELPTLPEGWVYEGWVVGPDGPLSTGRFSSVQGADSDGAGESGGPEASPPFPGQDFLEPALDLTSGYAAVISIEPESDNSPAPFAYKPLLDASIEDVGPLTLQEMANNAQSLASGTAILEMSAEALAQPTKAQPVVVLQGQFKDADSSHKGSGTATVYQLAEGALDLHLEDFSVTDGPDLHVLLATSPSPTGRSDLGDYLDLGSLQSISGNQNYDIPADTNITQFKSVVIYCEPFHIIFSTATLN